ncbi:hypothetical protein HMPREF2738_02387, partial [Clostridiales bacterium KLE1615]
TKIDMVCIKGPPFQKRENVVDYTYIIRYNISKIKQYMNFLNCFILKRERYYYENK